MSFQEKFLTELKTKIADKDFRQRSSAMLDAMEINRVRGIGEFSNLLLAKQRAAYTKWKVTENLDKYLVDFEGSVIRRGGKVVWAYDAQNALTEIDQIIKRTGARKIVKSKSELSNEIGLLKHLRSKSNAVVETDIGDYILDLLNEKSFQSTLPALSINKAEMGKVLNQKIRSSLEADDQEIISDIRAELRNEFYEADIGITGANFLIADSGSIGISENQGNSRLSFAFVKTQIVLASIDQILPTINDLELFFPLSSTFSTGQQLNTYNTITGPSYREDTEGPSEFIVILVDNGRSNVLSTQDQRQALHCIKCNACDNVCPVFKVVGGEGNFQSYKGGPIGLVMAPIQQGFEDFNYLSNASTFCGNCTQVCPVNIDIHNHILRNRHDNVLQGFEKTGEKLAWYTWKKFMLNRKNLNRPAGIKNFTLRQFFKSDWSEEREFPKIAEKSFNQMWRERNGIGK
jgi:L-lactate dehydrogenase complex protein LldF